MKMLPALLSCALFIYNFEGLQAQTDTSRRADYTGTYLMIDSTFPVNEIEVYWKDTTLSFSADGKKGVFRPAGLDKFSFEVGDYTGTASFTRGQNGKVDRILIDMDDKIYTGLKKGPPSSTKNRLIKR
jgi:hypothetical protein